MGNRVYKQGGYVVSVRADGAIYVNQNDSLSKYSMAMHGSFNFDDHFGRKSSPGGPVVQIPKSKRDLIFTGETIYYIGTLPPGGVELHQIPEEAPDYGECYVPSQAEVQAYVDMMSSRYGLSSELKAKYLRWASNGKLMTQVVGIGAFFVGGSVAITAGVFGALLTPILAIAKLAKIRAAPERFYGLRGIPYALTSWSYSGTFPAFPEAMAQHYRDGHLSGDNVETRIRGARQAFNESVAMIRMNLQSTINNNPDLTAAALKDFYVSLSPISNNPKSLAAYLLEQLADEMQLGHSGQSGFYRNLLLAPESDYPRI